MKFLLSIVILLTLSFAVDAQYGYNYQRSYNYSYPTRYYSYSYSYPNYTPNYSYPSYNYNYSSPYTYSYHDAGWYQGKWFPSGYYYWDGTNWILKNYGIHYGYPYANYDPHYPIPTVPIQPVPNQGQPLQSQPNQGITQEDLIILQEAKKLIERRKLLNSLNPEEINEILKKANK